MAHATTLDRRHIFPLLKLPRELRDEIYNHMLESRWRPIFNKYSWRNWIDLDMMDLEAPMNMLLSNRQIGSESFSRRKRDAALRVKDYGPAVWRPGRMFQIMTWLRCTEFLVVDLYLKHSIMTVESTWLPEVIKWAPQLKGLRVNLRGLYVPAPLLKFDQLRFGSQLWPRLECMEEVYVYDLRHQEDWSHEIWPTLKWSAEIEKFERVAFEPAML